MIITLLRHGKPEAVTNAPIQAHEFADWIKQYDQSGIAKDSHPTKESLVGASSCKVVLCSTLLRSKESAALITKDLCLTPDCYLIEAGMPHAEWHGVKIPPKYWAIIFRLLWYFGYSQNAESYSDAKLRAKAAAYKLTQTATTHGSVLFVGHGIFNRLVAKELRALNWSGPMIPGTKYWGLSVYKK